MSPEHARGKGRRAAAAIALAAVVGVSAFAAYFFLTTNPSQQDPDPTPEGPKIVYIFVNESIYGSLKPDIDQYEQDVEARGWNVRVFNKTWPDALQLKANLTQAYNTFGIKGAILVGSQPHQLRVENGEVFPQELFFMDLDGHWDNPDGDLIMDNHSAGAGDMLPEIWVARLFPEATSTFNIQLYHNYFNRLHAYRNGSLSRPHSMLVYQEDTWANTAWVNNITAYTNVTFCMYSTPTTASSYLNNITTIPYEFVHLFCHADVNNQYHEPSLPGNTINSLQIQLSPIMPLFYNLYCCQAAKFTQQDCLAFSYLFSGSTLGVVASTRNNGGMTMNHFFYVPLGRGECMGEAFRQWWTPNYENLHGPHWNYSMGVSYYGDPLITIV